MARTTATHAESAGPTPDSARPSGTVIPAADIADPDKSPDPRDPNTQPDDGGVSDQAKRAASRIEGDHDLIPVGTVAAETLEPGAARAVGYDHVKGEYLRA